MSKKKKKDLAVPVDVIKALWEKYADVIMEGYADQLEEQSDSPRVLAIAKKMKAFRHEFNKGQK